MNFFKAICVASLLATPLFAQDTTIVRLVTGLNYSRANFDNWSKGGEKATLWNFNIDGSRRTVRSIHSWTHELRFVYGEAAVGDTPMRKSQDELRFNSLYSPIVFPYVNPYVRASAETQLFSGYQYDDSGSERVSSPFDPLFLTQAVGAEYKKDAWVARTGFALQETYSYRHNFANDPKTETREEWRVEPGWELEVGGEVALGQSLFLQSNLRKFTNFKGFKQIDARWENKLSASITRHFNILWEYELLYDYDLSNSRQVRQGLALNFQYRFL
jgi:hypothetical protein